MPEDATLDAFASQDAAESDGDQDAESDEAEVDGATEDAPGSDDPTADSPDNVEESTEESAVEVSEVDPARSTYDWTPDGGECADCGASAERRWRADGQTDGGLVCADCKEW